MTSSLPILAWARTPVAPVGGAFSSLAAHALGAPVVERLLRDAGMPTHAVDALVLGNALGAGGNPARLVALAAGLPEACAAISIDTQCCAGLDAVAVACGMIASGQADVVIAGGAEAWSRSPLRLHRPVERGAPAVPYEQPPFTPWPDRDPDMLQAAASLARQAGLTRARQEAYTAASHANALRGREAMLAEIVPLAGLAHDAYPRALTMDRLARMPVVAGEDPPHAISTACVSAKADGAALVLLASEAACRRWGSRPQAYWQGSVSVGSTPELPMRAAAVAARRMLARAGWALTDLQGLELHDAFAAQGLDFCADLGLTPAQINRAGGGLARGHPIAASGAIALVRLLTQLRQQRGVAPARGLACVAGAGGIGAAIAVTTVPVTV